MTHYIGVVANLAIRRSPASTQPANLTRGGQYLALGVLIAMNVIGYGPVWARSRKGAPARPTRF